MIPRQRKIKKADIKQELLSTSYVRAKYLMGKEKSYLNLMAQFLEKVCSYVSYICF